MSSGIEPATFRFVARWLDQTRRRVPQLSAPTYWQSILLHSRQWLDGGRCGSGEVLRSGGVSQSAVNWRGWIYQYLERRGGVKFPGIIFLSKCEAIEPLWGGGKHTHTNTLHDDVSTYICFYHTRNNKTFRPDVMEKTTLSLGYRIKSNQ
jgi:hypothetical protein